MKPGASTIAWIFYLFGTLILFFGLAFRYDHKILYILIASLILTVPWLVCIFHAVRSKGEGNGLWIFLLIFFGIITIPIYLLRTRMIHQR